jgi:lipopolysaccharide biosynthesis regulator YciM
MFRGVNYKCAMLHYNNGDWLKAIREFEQIVNETDPPIYEMLAKCYQRSGNNERYLEYLQLAVNSYEALGETDKANRLKLQLPLPG